MSSEVYKYYKLSESEKSILLQVVKSVLESYGVDLAIIFGSFIELEEFRDIDIYSEKKTSTQSLN